MEHVGLREVPERVVLVERRRLVVAEVPEFTRWAFEAHRSVLADAGASPAGAPYLVFVTPLTDEVAGTVEACTPVPDAVARRTDLPPRVEPVHREAFTTLVKREVAYPRILDAHALVETSCRQEGLTLVAPPREIYFADIERAGDDDPVVDVAQPVE